MMNHSLHGKVALVTGAASGNGLAIAERLLAEGMRVAMLDIDEPALEAACADHTDVVALLADVSSEERVLAAVARVEDEYGQLDVLVNNAGIVRFGTLPDLTVEEWEQVFSVNSTAPFIVSKACRNLMTKTVNDRKDGTTASIINITSVEAHVVISSSGHPQVHYNASKGALAMLTKALSVECATDRIRVNAVAPGFIETPFTRDALSDPSTRRWILDRTPRGRVGRPSDVAGAVRFLASADADYVTGTTLMIDGGWSAL